MNNNLLEGVMLTGKRAVITGGSDGIGFGIARAFAKNGANVLLIARDEKKLKDSASALSSYGVEVEVLPRDISDAVIDALAMSLSTCCQVRSEI